jgi:hypothetical protein
MQHDLVAIEALTNRYSIVRSTLYERLAKIGIKPTKIGRRAFLTLDEQDTLDRLNNYLNEGGTCDSFEQTAKLEKAGEIEVARTESYADMLMLIEAISKHFKSESVDPLANQKALLFAADNMLILPSSQIKKLIGKKPVGAGCTWGCFSINWVGRVGRESGWLVSRK